MYRLPEKLSYAVKEFSKLQGIGEKSALRLFLQLTKWKKEDVENLSLAIRQVSNLQQCPECFSLTDFGICSLCQESSSRDRSSLLVVEGIQDLLAIEASHHYQGLFHVLGGVLNPLLGVGPSQLNLTPLFARIEKEKMSEVILALPPTIEGDATCAYIRQKLSGNVNLKRIGFGVPIGGNLEYLDPLTISKALENSRSYS